MNVSEDSKCRGTWHYCRDCRFAGDIADLAAACWECSRTVAVNRIISAGLGGHAAPKPGRTWYELVADMRGFWEAAKRGLDASALDLETRHLFARLNILAPRTRWRLGPGLMLGCCTTAALRPLLLGAQPSDLRPMRDNHIALVCAHYDRPGRIVGFSVATKTCRGKDVMFRAPSLISAAMTRSHFIADGELHEGGLAGWETLEASKRSLQGCALVVSDPFFAARLQSRHIETSTTPLPIVAYHDTPRARTQRGWDCLDGFLPLFWSFGMTPATVHHARKTNGLISIIPFWTHAKERFDREIRSSTMAAHMRSALRRALPWRDALAKWANLVPLAKVEELLIGLESYGDLTPYRNITEPLDILIDVAAPRTEPAVTYHKVTVVERADTWHSVRADGKSTLVANFRLRVTKASADPIGYEGLIHFQGQTAPFKITHDATMNSANLCRILQQCLLRAGIAGVLYTESGWSVRLLAIAQLFRRPESL